MCCHNKMMLFALLAPFSSMKLIIKINYLTLYLHLVYHCLLLRLEIPMIAKLISELTIFFLALDSCSWFVLWSFWMSYRSTKYNMSKRESCLPPALFLILHLHTSCFRSHSFESFLVSCSLSLFYPSYHDCQFCLQNLLFYFHLITFCHYISC
jgi:hypothetical protein